MTPPADTERYQHHRFPGAIISYGVWLSYRFTLSYRDVEDLLFERGIMVSHEAIRASLHPPSHRSSHPHLPLVRAGSPRETRAADRWREGRTVPSIIGLSPA